MRAAMNRCRTALLACIVTLVAACAGPAAPRPDAAALAALAPTGKLRAALYVGSPTSVLMGADGKPARGVAYDLGAELARAAGVPYEPVVFPNNEKVLEAARAGSVDVIFTNATAARAQFIDFAPTLFELEKSYLVTGSSSLRTHADIDRAGVRVGVSRGSSSAGELAGLLKNATLVPQPSLDEARRALAERSIDAFATNSAILFEMSERLPGSRVLAGSWGGEAISFGIPKGRAAARPFLDQFAAHVRANGAVRAAIERAGLRGYSMETSR
jgi:polar amino acid transport system substrate-binding protein